MLASSLLSALASFQWSVHAGEKRRSDSWGEAKIVKSVLGDPVPPAPGSGENVLVIGVAGEIANSAHR